MKAKIRRARARTPKDSPRRFLTQHNLREIRWGISLANGKAKREGQKPLDPQIILFSCRCNCFHIKVG